MIKYRTYANDSMFCADYYNLRNFLIELDAPRLHFGDWDWLFPGGWMDIKGMEKYGLWEDDGRIIAAATMNEYAFGSAFIHTLPGYEFLKQEMLKYACDNFRKDGGLKVIIPDGDGIFQSITADSGFVPTQDKESYSIYNINDPKNISYSLPDGFRITSMADDYDIFKYRQVLWRGFDHEANGEGPAIILDEELPHWHMSMKRPNVNLDLKIAVAAPNGDFVSYCGMWHDNASDSALVEPVATDPAYRRMGLGRAAVLEGVKRCGLLGTKRAYVGSSQQFYYSIGFRPYSTSTWWRNNEL